MSSAYPAYRRLTYVYSSKSRTRRMRPLKPCRVYVAGVCSIPATRYFGTSTCRPRCLSTTRRSSSGCNWSRLTITPRSLTTTQRTLPTSCRRPHSSANSRACGLGRKKNPYASGCPIRPQKKNFRPYFCCIRQKYRSSYCLLSNFYWNKTACIQFVMLQYFYLSFYGYCSVCHFVLWDVV